MHFEKGTTVEDVITDAQLHAGGILVASETGESLPHHPDEEDAILRWEDVVYHDGMFD